jgi:hypothetical protein
LFKPEGEALVISHKYRFIFIKTQKTAGTSIEVFLSQCCGDDDVLTPIHPHVEPHRARNYRGLWNPLPEILHKRGAGLRRTLSDFRRRNRFYNHIPAVTARERMPRGVWNNYFKFCVERNPWDKNLSHYNMLNQRAGGGMTLDEFLASGRFCHNYRLYTDLKGELIVDRVIKYESLDSELAHVFNALGVPFEGTLGVRAKSDYRRDRRPYREVFGPRQKAVIEEAFAREIRMHGYEF